jgi:DNA mismatch repair ATPase MutL
LEEYSPLNIVGLPARLTQEEMAALLREWSACEFGAVCPHGRPIVKLLPLADLLREFGRI